MNHESDILRHGFTLEQAQEEPSLSALKKTMEATSVARDILKTDLGSINPGFGGGGILLACVAEISTLLDPKSSDPCINWGLTTKGCGYLNVLTRQETLAKEMNNYHSIIFYLALLSENELLSLVVNPLRRYALEICDILRKDNPEYRTEALENFAKGKVKPTFWTLVMLLRGLEIGEGHYSHALSNRINSLFHPSYTRSIRKANLSRAADTFRWKYRNPSCHPDQAEFSQEEAARACKLILGFPTVEAWSHGKVDPEQHHSGLLSTHLALKLR
jgi:hypothetical protein